MAVACARAVQMLQPTGCTPPKCPNPAAGAGTLGDAGWMERQVRACQLGLGVQEGQFGVTGNQQACQTCFRNQCQRGAQHGAEGYTVHVSVCQCPTDTRYMYQCVSVPQIHGTYISVSVPQIHGTCISVSVPLVREHSRLVVGLGYKIPEYCKHSDYYDSRLFTSAQGWYRLVCTGKPPPQVCPCGDLTGSGRDLAWFSGV